jgi:ABC-type cobalamin/Fe3+-siderophores transport system ATPase subunit
VCFARAALYKTPIVVLDEPTSSCDLTTDIAVQAMVRREFTDATIITIAHRLNTIIDYVRNFFIQLHVFLYFYGKKRDWIGCNLQGVRAFSLNAVPWSTKQRMM